MCSLVSIWPEIGNNKAYSLDGLGDDRSNLNLSSGSCLDFKADLIVWSCGS